MAEKVTEMVLVLKVDLECSCCYKKVEKLLCKFPQIRDQVYDAKQNTVAITVVCCNPEKMRDKLCCKGRKVITCIKPPPGDAPACASGGAPACASGGAPASAPVSAPAGTPAGATMGAPVGASAPDGCCCSCSRSCPRTRPPPTPDGCRCSCRSSPPPPQPDGCRCSCRSSPPPPPPDGCWCSCYDVYWCEYRYRYGYCRNRSYCVGNCFNEENPQGCTSM